MNSKRRRERLHDIQRIGESLREEIAAPDLTDAILERVHAERPFMSRHGRLVVNGCKVAVALGVLAVVGAIVQVRLAAPQMEMVATPAQPAVFAPAVDSLRFTAANAVEQFRAPIIRLDQLAVTKGTARMDYAVSEPEVATPSVTTASSVSTPMGTTQTPTAPFVLPIDEDSVERAYGGIPTIVLASQGVPSRVFGVGIQKVGLTDDPRLFNGAKRPRLNAASRYFVPWSSTGTGGVTEAKAATFELLAEFERWSPEAPSGDGHDQR